MATSEDELRKLADDLTQTFEDVPAWDYLWKPRVEAIERAIEHSREATRSKAQIEPALDRIHKELERIEGRMRTTRHMGIRKEYEERTKALNWVLEGFNDAG